MSLTIYRTTNLSSKILGFFPEILFFTPKCYLYQLFPSSKTLWWPMASLKRAKILNPSCAALKPAAFLFLQLCCPLSAVTNEVAPSAQPCCMSSCLPVFSVLRCFYLQSLIRCLHHKAFIRLDCRNHSHSTAHTPPWVEANLFVQNKSRRHLLSFRQIPFH